MRRLAGSAPLLMMGLKFSGQMEEACTPGEVERSLSHSGITGDAGKGQKGHLGEKLQRKFEKGNRSPCHGR